MRAVSIRTLASSAAASPARSRWQMLRRGRGCGEARPIPWSSISRGMPSPLPSMRYLRSSEVEQCVALRPLLVELLELLLEVDLRPHASLPWRIRTASFKVRFALRHLHALAVHFHGRHRVAEDDRDPPLTSPRLLPRPVPLMFPQFLGSHRPCLSRSRLCDALLLRRRAARRICPRSALRLRARSSSSLNIVLSFGPPMGPRARFATGPRRCTPRKSDLPIGMNGKLSRELGEQAVFSTGFAHH